MTTMSEAQYQLLPADRAADDLERELLERWESEDLVRQTLEKNATGTPWVRGSSGGSGTGVGVGVGATAR